MKWNSKFSYPKSMRSMISGSRMYAVNQEKLPSVTSILQATQSEEKKASLANWKARVGTALKQIELKMMQSSRGTSMHGIFRKIFIRSIKLRIITRKKIINQKKWLMKLLNKVLKIN